MRRATILVGMLIVVIMGALSRVNALTHLFLANQIVKRQVFAMVMGKAQMIIFVLLMV